MVKSCPGPDCSAPNRLVPQGCHNRQECDDWWLVAIVAGLCAAGLFLWARGRSRAGTSLQRPSRHSVVLITIDTLRADRVGRGLTPSLDALAADGGARFTHARPPSR